MTPADLSQALFDLVAAIVERRRAAGDEIAFALTPEQVTLERPKQREHGDWASNLAMRMAKPLGANPRELASELAAGLANVDGVASAEVAGPGFINIRLEAAAAGELARTIVEAGAEFGRTTTLAGRRINLEFVSANPTGPLHIGHTRWAALGDAIGRVLRAAGADVANEYYINDAGNQMDTFGESVLAAAKGEPTPENGYPGQYIADLAARVLEREPNLLELDHEVALHTAREIAYDLQLAEIRASLERFNVHFDVWSSERLLHAKDDEGVSAVDAAVERLRAQGHVYDHDDAIWVRTTDFGDDKDRVIRRGNGVYTYFAADAAYYLDKGDRGFEHKIYLLGADHHGYVHRLRALAGAAGDDPQRDIEVLIGQLVSVNGAKLSKRAGNIIELDDLQAWLGTDALRYTLARYPADSPLAIDPEQLRSRTNDNPVFYVQYAHARTAAVARNALASGVDRSEFAPQLLEHETESALLGALQDFPRIVAQAAELREPHRVARYIEELAGLYHRWYDNCRVIPLGDDPVTDLHRTRLWLNDATGQVVRNGLDLLGVSAPERM
ncbi:arginine--tRNA ligase [Agromyces aerolatus]|uniref:arginine--tRNA ligase n=1 Tax=Agromyces sp. LY-1074 TaxID=3074080 RepID=UPI00285D4B4E|nr:MULTISPECIES: arginine--tRNA ligase [unclassified Agromyces]MDR5701806.1 arginine--tRNA ligase [Agromyces sp. LY-1074]MDR5707524.1 arginine--tRNA ligase [Agromyces sp. LY-1358]